MNPSSPPSNIPEKSKDIFDNTWNSSSHWNSCLLESRQVQSNPPSSAGTFVGIWPSRVWVHCCNGENEMSLSDTEIRKSKVGPKAYKLSDGGGLYLWITPAGGKLWRWAYRHAGKQKTMTFGRYPDVSLAMARDRHREARTTLATGVDPMVLRRTEKRDQQISSANSFESVTARWLDHWADGKSPRHVDYVRRRITADILPCLGARPIAEIEAPELVVMTKAIEERGARDIAKRAEKPRGRSFAMQLRTDTPDAIPPQSFVQATSLDPPARSTTPESIAKNSPIY
jgi:hypothetical protein